MELTKQDGTLLEVGDELGRGGRGSVYLIERGRMVAKVFKEQSRTARRRDKVACERALRDTCFASVAWPIEDVYEDGRWAGYTMERIVGRGLDEVSHDETVPFSDRVCYAKEMAEIIDDLHRCGVVMGDVSLANFVVSHGRRAQVVAIDPDSFQVKDDEAGVCYPTTESREKSPEMIEQGDLGGYFLTSRSDDFLLASAVFELLFGVHPLDGGQSDMPPSQCRQANAKERTFAFLARPGATLEGVGRDLEALFIRSFMGDAKSVPAAREYASALDDLISDSQDDEGGKERGGVRRAIKVVATVFPAVLALACAAVLATGYDQTWIDATYLKGCTAAYAALAAGSFISRRWFPVASLVLTFVMFFTSDATALCLYMLPAITANFVGELESAASAIAAWVGF